MSEQMQKKMNRASLKNSIVFIFVIISCSIFANTQDLNIFLKEILQNDEEFNRNLNRLELENADFIISKSMNWFDINVSYSQTSNEIKRSDIEDDDTEISDIDENDTRWKYEITRKFFDKDFSTTSNDLDSRKKIIRYKNELLLERYKILDDRISEMISYYNALTRHELLNKEKEILDRETKILDRFDKQNLVDSITLIENLEAIDDLESDFIDINEDIADYKLYESSYNTFLSLFKDFCESEIELDTLRFTERIDFLQESRDNEISKLKNRFKLHELSYFFPELEFSFSYNTRNIEQDWSIAKNITNLKTLDRENEEEYFEGQIELSIPFNFISNLKGKKLLLKTMKKDLLLRENVLNEEYLLFKQELLLSYKNLRKEYYRKTRLKELYQSQFEIIKNTILPNDSEMDEIKLVKSSIRFSKAKLNCEITKMKLYKTIFIINNFGEF